MQGLFTCLCLQGTLNPLRTGNTPFISSCTTSIVKPCNLWINEVTVPFILSGTHLSKPSFIPVLMDLMNKNVLSYPTSKGVFHMQDTVLGVGDIKVNPRQTVFALKDLQSRRNLDAQAAV